MPTLTPEDEKKDTLNPGQADYDRRFNDIRSAEEKAAFDDIANNFDSSTADPSDENANIRKLQEKESQGVESGPWKNNTSERSEKAKFNWKKKGPLIGVTGGFGLAAIFFSTFIGPSMLLPSLSNMAFAKNDSRGTILERRLVKIIETKLASRSGDICGTSKARCDRSRIPKSMLSAMERKGIVPLDERGNKMTISGNGYAETKPAAYRYVDSTGATKVINASEFMDNYKNNPAFRKAFKSAYNMRFLGYNGVYMFKNFFKKLGLNRNGGSAAASAGLTEATVNDVLDEKTKARVSADNEEGTKNTIKQRLRTLLQKTGNKVKKIGGDPILMTGVVGCAAIELPTFVAGAYRAIQLSQVVALANDIVMSPGGMQQAGHAKSESISALGKLLTDRKQNSDGTLGKSALDSKILQSAIGVNKNKVSLTNATPGYSLITNKAVQTSASVAEETKGVCRMIMSPQAAVVATTVEGAITAGTAGIGGIVIGSLKALGKLALTFGLIEGSIKAAEASGLLDYITDQGYNIVKNALGNYVEGAKHEELGDALGVGMYAFFSQAGSVGGGAVLKTDQVDSFSAAIAAIDNEYREEAIATLSPFDTSSHYTFLGSIVSDLSLSTTQNNPVTSTLSMVGHIIRSPISLLSKSAGAQVRASEATCGYAAELGLDESIAINPAGYPCIGIPTQYLNMSPERVLELVEDQIDPETGEPKPDSDMALMLEDCADGDLEAVSGCTIDAVPAVNYTGTYEAVLDEKITVESYTLVSEGKSAEQRAAESLYLFDQQIENILNGQDSEEGGASIDADIVEIETSDDTISNTIFDTLIVPVKSAISTIVSTPSNIGANILAVSDFLRPAINKLWFVEVARG